MHRKTIDYSVELFPPSTPAGRENLRVTVSALAALNPRFFSVTFGAAGAATQQLTTSLVSELVAADIETAPHMTCLHLTPSDVDHLLQTYRAQGIRRLVVIRGDEAENAEKKQHYFSHAVELVRYIREKTGDWFALFVAAYPEFHPECMNCETEFQYLAAKAKAGATAAITQYFFSQEAY